MNWSGKHSTKQRENYCWRNLLTGHLLCARGRWYLCGATDAIALMRFNKLYTEINQGKIDSGRKVETMDNIFPEINYRVYRPLSVMPTFSEVQGDLP